MKIQSLCLTFGFAAALAVSACEDGDRAAVAEMGGANGGVANSRWQNPRGVRPAMHPG